MTRATVIKGASIHEILDHCRQALNAWGEPATLDQPELWFRGLSSTDHQLVPSVYRHPNANESSLLSHFQCLAPAYFASGAPRDDWEWLFAAQHYGLPTRLLDWSESLATALFFAVGPAQARERPTPPVSPKRAKRNASKVSSTEQRTTGSRPCVWMIDAAALNRIATKEYSVFVPGGEFSKNWLPHLELVKRARVSASNRAARSR